MRIILVIAIVLVVGLGVLRSSGSERPAGTTASQPVDEAEGFIRMMDERPADQRPPNWAQTKKLMARKPPTVGQVAPDFTLKTRDDSQSITRSVHQGDRPLVLIFGSFT